MDTMVMQAAQGLGERVAAARQSREQGTEWHCGACHRAYTDILACLAHVRAVHPKAATRLAGDA